MPLPNIIAICGAKRSGKDTLANYLVDCHAYNKLAFADPLKQAVAILFGFSDEQVGIDYDGDKKEELDENWGITPRKALQFFGTEVMQYKIQELLPNIDRKFFAYSLGNKIKDIQNMHMHKNDIKFVISDMRFLHEYEELKKLGAYIIRVDRTRAASDTSHCSEIEYKNIPYDLLLHNDEDIASFLEEADGYLTTLDR